MTQVVLGLSGGVDSAVAARRLAAQGFCVHGVFLSHGGVSDEAARRAAAELGISFETVDISDALERNVMSAFERAYREGRTPNPCAVCNPTTKFPALIAVADRVGAQFVATGHYARAIEGGLYKNPSASDQSYMLNRLPTEILKRCVFPLGDIVKSDTRREAEGLSAADAPDSMEICFIPDDDYVAWLARRGVVFTPGYFVDTAGNVLGRHDGCCKYTVGQRRGLGVSAGERLFVKTIDTTTNRIILAQESEMYTDTVRARDVLRFVEMDLENGTTCEVKLRHSRRSDAAFARTVNDELVIKLERPARLAAPGQFAALYIGERLVASGEITGC